MKIVFDEDDGFGEIINFAEMIGWVDPSGSNLSPSEADGLEEDAIAYINSRGIEVQYVNGESSGL